ncbi:hypothetical protein Tco_1347339, partial [Tanacetum coccineum]
LKKEWVKVQQCQLIPITHPSVTQRKQKSRRPKEKDTQVPQSSVPSDPTNVADEKRVKKLEKKEGSRTYKLKRLYKVGRSARVVSSEEASLGDQEDASKQGRKIDDIDKDADITLVHKTQVSATTITNVELTLAQTLAELKSARPKTKGVKGQGLKDKGKAKMIEADKALKKKDQIKFDEEEALRL